MVLRDELQSIKRVVEGALKIRLTTDDFSGGQDDSAELFFHQTCQAAVLHCVPWINASGIQEHAIVLGVMTGLLVRAIGSSVNINPKGDLVIGQHLEDALVSNHPADAEHFVNVWETYFWPNKDLAGMATYVLDTTRHQRLIYHILPQDDWDDAQKADVYQPESLSEEGFIHCSDIDQVTRSANKYFSQQRNLRLLCIASEKVAAEIRYEDFTGEGIRFPHIYGPLNLDAVVRVSKIERDDAGLFVLPAGRSASGV